MTEPTDVERAAFEEMMCRETFDDLARLSDGTYKSYEARVGWIAWQAARRTPAPVGVEPVARLEIGKTKGGVSLTHIAEPAAFQLPEGMYALYTADQVLAMGRVPVADEEIQPIVRNSEAPGDLKLGDYVFASRWSDCDPGDPWAVGFVSEVGSYLKSVTKAGYIVLRGGSRRWGRAMRITQEQGRRICEQFPAMERLPTDYKAIARVFGIKGGQHAE